VTRFRSTGSKRKCSCRPEGYLANGDRNENSIVLRLGFGRSSFLLPGDGETTSEQFLVDEYGAGLNATALSAGHHGSQSSSGSEFLDVTDPRIAVVSSGYDSQYDHPHESVLDRFSQQSIRTYWTATHGTVRLTSNGSAITVATQRDAPTAPLALRDGEPIEPGVDDALQSRTVISITESTTSPVVPDGGTETNPTEPTEPTEQAGALSIVTIHEDAAGDESDNLNDEYIVFENTGDQPLELDGWSVADEAGHTYTFPSGFALDSGAQVRSPSTPATERIHRVICIGIRAVQSGTTAAIPLPYETTTGLSYSRRNTDDTRRNLYGGRGPV